MESNAETIWNSMDESFSQIKSKFDNTYRRAQITEQSPSRTLVEFGTNDNDDISTLPPITLAKDRFYLLTPLDNQLCPYPFKQLRNKVVLIVNVALYCGFRYQYKYLERLQKKYEKEGFTIIGFPCNQFLFQEPFSNEEIVTKCRNKYDVTFPIMNKIHVNGPQADEVYKFLKECKPGLWGTKRVKWNFEKFLIDSEGNIVARYSTFTSPEAISGKIEEMLEKKKTMTVV